ncbi:MAG: hypothetical protein GX596_15080 [Propionibacterium sp.]|nr:hypothetical protein [Propionibacterium sp.]
MAKTRVTAATLRARQMMQGALLLAHAVGFGIIGLAFALDGVSGLITAALGFAAVIIFYAIGQALEVVATEMDPMQGMGLVLASYGVRVVGIAAGLWAILSLEAVAEHVIDLWLLLSVTATVIAWVTGVVVVASRQRVPVYDEDYVTPGRNEES